MRDFAPKLATSLGKGLISDCIGYRHENGRLVFVRQLFQGKTAADVTFAGAGAVLRLAAGRSVPRRPGRLAAHRPRR